MQKHVYVIVKSKARNYLILSRTKKYFASLHNVDRCIFIFPNTPLNSIRLHNDLKILKSLHDFKIKLIQGGFQRRPERLINCPKTHNLKSDKFGENNKNSTCIGHLTERKLIKNHRIQYELISMALKLSNAIDVKCESSQAEHQTIVNSLPLMVLDIGCGDGMSMMPILNLGHHCIGVDVQLQSLIGFKNDLNEKGSLLNSNYNISLWPQTTAYNANSTFEKNINDNRRNKTHFNISSMSDLLRWDLRYGLPFKENSFDLAVSISFLQWLFYGPWQQQLESFFVSLRRVVTSDGKAVIQFYPASVGQVENAINIAMKHFKGVLIGDYPHIDRGRKLFLILF